MKKNNYFGAFALVLLCLGFSSCNKEEFGNIGNAFLCSIENDSKTHLNGTGVEWNAGDKIAVFNQSTGDYGIYQTTAEGTTAVFEYYEGTQLAAVENGNFRAIYPSTCMIEEQPQQIRIPQTQSGAITGPMYASSNNNHLAFKNVCGALKLHLTRSQASGTITRIVFSCTNLRINGTFVLASAGQDSQRNAIYKANAVSQTLDNSNLAYHQIVVDYGTAGLPISTTNDLYIYLPEGNYKGVNIVVYGREPNATSETELMSLKAKNNTDQISFTRNVIRKISKVLPSPNSTKGLFSIDDNHQVFIANGNLWNTVGPLNTNYNDHWIFAERPYDFIGTIADGTHQGKWNRFSWATTDAATLDGMSMYDHQVLNTLSGNFKDFGNHTISGDPAGTWFTLTENEWMYLLGMSSVNWNVSYNGGRLAAGKMYWDEPGDVAANKAYGYCYVIPEQGADYIVCKYNGRDVHVNRTFFMTNATTQNHTVNNKTITVVHSGKVINGLGTNDEFAGIPCLVIYPDRFPKSKMLISEEYSYYNHAVAITDARYQELVELGCAFLPLLGQGQAQGQNANNEIRNVLTHGYYWTRTGAGQSAKCLVLNHQAPDITFRFDPDTRGNGNAVRLMQPSWEVSSSILYSGTRTGF